jgi:large subunit ribosomal protein L18e
MARHPTGPSDYNVRVLIRQLHQTKRPLWRVIARKLEKPRRNRVEAGLWRINRETKAGEIIVIPGKVLNGNLEHKVTIGSIGISTQALQKVKQAGGEWMPIPLLLEKYPDGKGVKIFF